MEEILPGIWRYARPLTGFGVDICSVLLKGPQATMLVDTFSSPHHLDEFLNSPMKNARGTIGSMLRGTECVFVVYTHSDWDHCLGTGALDESGIRYKVICHHLTKQLLETKGEEEIRKVRSTHPDLMKASKLTLPHITFDGKLTVELGGDLGTIELSNLPGHTKDSVVCYLPKLKTLVAGDSVENPVPLIGDARDLLSWATGLEQYAKVADLVIPSHGEVSGPELLVRNASYIRSRLA